MLDTILSLAILMVLVEILLKKTFIGKALKLMWQTFVGLTKMVCFAIGRINGYVKYINKKLEPEKQSQTKKEKSNVINLQEAKSHRN